MDIEYIRQQLNIAEKAIQNCQAQLPPQEGQIFLVHPEDDIQSVIDSVPNGSILEFLVDHYVLDASLTIPRGKTLTLRARGGVPDGRVSPDESLPHLVTSIPVAILDASFASDLLVQGLYFEGSSQNDVIILDESQNVTLQHIVIMGNGGVKRGVRGNGSFINVIDSYIANIWREGQDSQAFCAWNSLGGIELTNCYFEAASENVMFGGADSVDADHIPSHITITNCDFSKRLEWKEKKNFYAVKNLLELKSARFVAVYKCTFAHNWTDAQSGFGIVIKSTNQDGGAPWSVTEHVRFTDCVLSDTDHGINIQGHDIGGVTTDINFSNCHISCAGIGLQIGAEAGVVNIEQCTFENGFTFLSLYADSDTQKAVDMFLLHATRGNHNDYGVKGGGTAPGTPTLDRYVGTCQWQDVLLLSPTEPHPYPPTTYFAESDVPAGVKIGAQV